MISEESVLRKQLQIAIGFFVKPLNSFPADSFIELVNVFVRIEQIARPNFKKSIPLFGPSIQLSSHKTSPTGIISDTSGAE